MVVIKPTKKQSTKITDFLQSIKDGRALRRVKTRLGIALPQEIKINGGVADLKKLKIGDSLISLKGKGKTKKQETQQITSVGKYTSLRFFYLVNDELPFHPHQSLVVDGKVIHAMHLKVGDNLEDENGKPIKVESVRKKHGKIDAVKVEVSGEHTYFLNGVLAHNASRYWVGGAGNWDASTTTHWSASSGGGGGASVPTSSDDVIFDSASNATAYTMTLNSQMACANLTMGHPLSGALTIATSGTNSTSIYGNLSLASGIVVTTFYSTWSFRATTGTATILTNGVKMYNVSITGAATFQLSDDLHIAFALNKTAGTFDPNGKAVVFGEYGAPGSINGVTSFYDLKLLNWNVSTNGLNLYNDITVTNAFTSTGYSATKRNFIYSNVLGTRRTITAASVTMSNTDFMDIAGAGAGTWSGTSIANGGNNTGITFTTPITCTWVGTSGGSWSNTAMWDGTIVPLIHDTVVFDANSITSGSRTITMDVAGVPSVSFANVANTPAVTISTQLRLYGDFNLTATGTFTPSGNGHYFYGRSNPTLTSAGKSFTSGWYLQTPGTTFYLGDDAVAGGVVYLYAGNFNAQNHNVSMNSFGYSPSTARTITMGDGTWTITGLSNAWIVSSTWDTIVCGNSTLKFTDSSNSNLDWNGQGKTYHTVWFSRGASTGEIRVYGLNTIYELKDTGTEAHSMLFSSNSTQHITNFTVSGTSGKLVTISTYNSTSPHYLVKDGGGIIQCDFLNVSHSVATPANSWYAGLNSTNGQSTTTAGSGWIFGVQQTKTTTAKANITWAGKAVHAQAKAAVKNMVPRTATAKAKIVFQRTDTVQAKANIYGTVEYGLPKYVAVYEGSILPNDDSSVYLPNEQAYSNFYTNNNYDSPTEEIVSGAYRQTYEGLIESGNTYRNDFSLNLPNAGYTIVIRSKAPNPGLGEPDNYPYILLGEWMDDQGIWWQARIQYNEELEQYELRVTGELEAGDLVITDIDLTAYHVFHFTFDSSNLKVYIDSVLKGTLVSEYEPSSNTPYFEFGARAYSIPGTPTDQLIAGSGADDNAVGNIAWTNPGNITAYDGNLADATVAASSEQTHWLKATNFGFDIPTGSIIAGILVYVSGKIVGVAGWQLDFIRIIKGGVIGTTVNKTAVLPNSTVNTVAASNSEDLWGETWTAEDINDEDFGVALSTIGSDGYTAAVSIEDFEIVVYYLPPETVESSFDAYWDYIQLFEELFEPGAPQLLDRSLKSKARIKKTITRGDTAESLVAYECDDLPEDAGWSAD